MALVVKRKKGQSQQQLINEFRRLTYDDPLLNQVKERLMMGYESGSVKRKKNKQRIDHLKSLARSRYKRSMSSR